MSNGTADEAKGRIKEAIGSLTDDDELKREGEAERAAGSIKEKLGKVVDDVRDAVTGRKDDS